MIIDIRSQPDGHRFEADVCFIGGGAASIAAAMRLRDTPLRVLVLESGGRKPDAASTDLAAGTGSGIPYFALDDSRVRMLGGSTYRWGARSSPMKPIDFARRDWAPNSGWPFGPEELAPFHDAVHQLIGLRQPFDYGEGVFELLKTPRERFDPDKLGYAAFQFGKNLIFGETFGAELEASPTTTVYLNATVTSVSLSPDGRRVREATIKTLNGKRFSAQARAFVLACGGIENARLLLNWTMREASGLGNASGHVGRYFMEHPTLTAGVVRSPDWRRLCDLFSPGLVDGRFIETGLAPSDSFQRDKRILNAVGRIRPIVTADATQALREILWNARHRKIPLSLQWYKNEWLRERVGAIAADPLSIPFNVLRHMRGLPKRFKADSVVLELRTEQAPNPESRVTLSDALDPLGLRRAHLHWAMTALDKRTMRVMTETIDSELRRLGLGSIDPHAWTKTDDLVWSDDIVGGHHHMGTTRMADDPRDGVVDRHLKAHGFDNFYVAGSSVFPTASFVNPTFTILCLALRLADRLKSDLTAPSRAAVVNP